MPDPFHPWQWLIVSGHAEKLPFGGGDGDDTFLVQLLLQCHRGCRRREQLWRDQVRFQWLREILLPGVAQPLLLRIERGLFRWNATFVAGFVLLLAGGFLPLDQLRQRVLRLGRYWAR